MRAMVGEPKRARPALGWATEGVLEVRVSILDVVLAPDRARSGILGRDVMVCFRGLGELGTVGTVAMGNGTSDPFQRRPEEHGCR